MLLYTVVLFCPKKLRNNWEQYQSHRGSRFERDEIEYFVRNHTDLQDERLTTGYPDFPLIKIQRKQKLLIVIDESHNLRNDKSSRYKFLVDNVLLPERIKRPDGRIVTLEYNSGMLNRLDRLTSANYGMPINTNLCENKFVKHKDKTIMLQATSIYTQGNGEKWDNKEMFDIMIEISKTSLKMLGSDLFNQITKK